MAYFRGYMCTIRPSFSAIRPYLGLTGGYRMGGSSHGAHAHAHERIGTMTAPGNEYDDDVNTGDQWVMPCCGGDYDCICDVVPTAALPWHV